MDILETPAFKRTYGGTIGHLITHSMHHRVQVMYLMENVGLSDHIEGNLLAWETTTFGWR